jgi:hypothetical protein
MRTTLDIDEDVLQAAKELAALRKTTAGRVLTDLARRGLNPPTARGRLRNTVPVLEKRPGGRRVTMKDVNRLRDEE